MKPLVTAFALSLCLVAGTAHAGGIVVNFPHLTFPDSDQIVTQDCVDLTVLGPSDCQSQGH